MRALLLLFILAPLIELYVLIKVGAGIGAGWTVILVVLTAVTGAVLVRTQGFAALQRARHNLQRHQLPALELLEGACLLVAGALLLTPGFITDTLGFALLIAPLRRALIARLMRRWESRNYTLLEGEWRHPDD